MGPAERAKPTLNLLPGGGEFDPPLRGPEPRVLPLDDPPPTHPTLPYPPTDGDHLPTDGRPVNRPSADRGLEGAARAEAWNFSRGNVDLFTGAGIASVARRATGDDERAEAGDRDAATPAERLDDAAHGSVHGAL